MATIRFRVTNGSDTKRCPVCHALVRVRDIDDHAKGHGYRPDEIRVEPGMTV